MDERQKLQDEARSIVWEPEIGIYRHFKGGLYFVEGCGEHTETGETMVVYRNHHGKRHIRPLEGLKGWVTDEIDREMPDGSRYTGPRFEFVGKVVK
jgi:hypothetical protein